MGLQLSNQLCFSWGLGLCPNNKPGKLCLPTPGGLGAMPPIRAYIDKSFAAGKASLLLSSLESRHNPRQAFSTSIEGDAILIENFRFFTREELQERCVWVILRMGHGWCTNYMIFAHPYRWLDKSNEEHLKQIMDDQNIFNKRLVDLFGFITDHANHMGLIIQ